MRAALLLAENEDWLSAGPSDCAMAAARLSDLRVSRHEPVQHRESFPAGVTREGLPPAEAPIPLVPPDARADQPAGPGSERARRTFAAIVASMLLHLGIALAAVGLLPSAPPLSEAERGGEPVLDVLMMGAEEATALFEGAKPQPVSLALPEIAAPVPPVTETPAPAPQPEPAILEPLPAPAMPPSPPEASPVPPMAEEPAGEILQPVPAPVPTPVPTSPAAEPPSRSLPAPVARNVATRKIETRKVETPKAEARPPPSRARSNPEARGRQGEGRAEANRAADTRGGTGGSAAMAGNSALTSFRSRVVAHLMRYKSYPEQAQERGITGRNAVTLTLSREGQVLSAGVSGPSGHALLDSATLAAVRRAQPFPAIPEGGPATITVTISLNYQLH